MHVYVCLLASMLYVNVSLSRSKLCHALCSSWACSCVVAFVSPRACSDVTTCKIHFHGVGVLDTHLSLLYVMLLCLSCLLCATHLVFFASLHLCTLAYMFMHEFLLTCVVHTPIQWNYGHLIQTYICPPRTPSFV